MVAVQRVRVREKKAWFNGSGSDGKEKGLALVLVALVWQASADGQVSGLAAESWTFGGEGERGRGGEGLGLTAQGSGGAAGAVPPVF